MLRKELFLIGLFLVTLISSLFCQKKLEIHHLKDNFYVFTTYQDFGGKPFPANGLYVLTEAGAVILDTPWDTTQCAPLLDSIFKKHGKKTIMSISTHWHEDRSGGIDIFKKRGVKTYSSLQTQLLCAEMGKPQAEFVFTKDTIFELGSLAFRTFYPGEGHAEDNQVVLFDKQKIVYGGCFIKSTESRNLGYVDDGDVAEWTRSILSLEKMIKKTMRRPKYVIPGHQSWKNKRSIRHTKALLKSECSRQKYSCF